MFGNKNSRVELRVGLTGLKEAESYIDFAMSNVKQSNLWKSKDSGFYDLIA